MEFYYIFGIMLLFGNLFFWSDLLGNKFLNGILFISVEVFGFSLVFSYLVVLDLTVSFFISILKGTFLKFLNLLSNYRIFGNQSLNTFGNVIFAVFKQLQVRIVRNNGLLLLLWYYTSFMELYILWYNRCF